MGGACDRQTGETPRAWVAPSEEDFIPGRAKNALTIRRIDANTLVVKSLKKACADTPNAKYLSAKQVIRRLDLGRRKNLSILALDVGQASCVAFSEGGRDIGYFDVGKPMGFNRKSFKKKFKRVFPQRGLFFSRTGILIITRWRLKSRALRSLIGMRRSNLSGLTS